MHGQTENTSANLFCIQAVTGTAAPSNFGERLLTMERYGVMNRGRNILGGKMPLKCVAIRRRDDEQVIVALACFLLRLDRQFRKGNAVGRCDFSTSPVCAIETAQFDP